MTRPRDFDDVLSRCDNVKRKGNTATADCPCPGHKTPENHLSVTDASRKCIVKCHSVHTYQEITEALGFESLTYSTNGHEPERREVAQYDYTNEDGELLYQVVRYEPKSFSQRRPDGNGRNIYNLEGVRRVLYHLPEVCDAVKAKRTVYVVEGEKDADNGRTLGLTFTTSPGGAEKWVVKGKDLLYSESLAGTDVVIIPDNDAAGEAHAQQVLESLKSYAASVRVAHLPPQVDGQPVKDLSDWIAAGGTREKLEALAQDATCLHAATENETQPEDEDEPDPSTVPVIPPICWSGFFRDYLDYARPTTEAPEAYHYAVALTVAGCLVGREIGVENGARPLFPNFYCVLSGRSGLSRKDTANSLGVDLLERLYQLVDSEDSPPFEVITGIRSAEGLLESFKGDDKRRLLRLGELYALASKTRQDSGATIKPFITEAWDNKPVLNPVIRSGRVIAVRPFLSILAATTTAWLAKSFDETDIISGYGPRFLFFHGAPARVLAWPPSPDRTRRDALLRRLNDLRKFAQDLPRIDGEHYALVGPDPEARDMYGLWYEELHARLSEETIMAALLNRLPQNVLKVALLYALLDSRETINACDMDPALGLAAYLEQTARLLFGNGTDTRAQLERRIIRTLRQNNGKMSGRDLCRALKVSATGLNSAAQPMLKTGIIVLENTGRQDSKVWRLLS